MLNKKSAPDIKKELRREYLARRKALQSDVVEAKSRQLVKQLLSKVDWQNIRAIHCFLPLAGDNEPDVRAFMVNALQHGVDVSTTDPSSATGRHVLELEDAALQERLQQYELSEAARFDLIVVPMIAYDPATNHRLGFGGGFYDKLLSAQPQARTIGVCFSELACELPSEMHDAAVSELLLA